MSEINRRVTELVCDVLGTDNFAVGPSTPRDAITQWDSLKHIQVILAIEDEFGIEFSDVEIATSRSIDDLLNLIARKVDK